jgi:hypothetical protein
LRVREKRGQTFFFSQASLIGSMAGAFMAAL